MHSSEALQVIYPTHDASALKHGQAVPAAPVVSAVPAAPAVVGPHVRSSPRCWLPQPLDGLRETFTVRSGDSVLSN